MERDGLRHETHRSARKVGLPNSRPTVGRSSTYCCEFPTASGRNRGIAMPGLLRFERKVRCFLTGCIATFLTSSLAFSGAASEPIAGDDAITLKVCTEVLPFAGATK